MLSLLADPVMMIAIILIAIIVIIVTIVVIVAVVVVVVVVVMIVGLWARLRRAYLTRCCRCMHIQSYMFKIASDSHEEAKRSRPVPLSTAKGRL